MRCNQYISSTNLEPVPAEKHPIMPPPNFAPLLIAPARVPPFLSHLSICSLVVGLEQRAIWARLPASSGGPLHRKDSFSSTSVCQDQRQTPSPLSLSISSFSSASYPAAKTSHTLNRKQAKCGTLLLIHVSLHLLVTSYLFPSPSGCHAFSQIALLSVFRFFR